VRPEKDITMISNAASAEVTVKNLSLLNLSILD